MQAFNVYMKSPVLTLSGFYKPLNIGRMIVFDRNRKLYGVALECEVKKGVLKRFSEIAEKVGAIIRFIQVSMEEIDEPFVRAIAFFEMSNSKITPEEVLELVRKQDFIREVQLIKPNPIGILCDNYFFPLIVGDERAVIFRKKVYEALFKGLREKFGSAGEAMLYYQGFNIGYELCNSATSLSCAEKLESRIAAAKAISRTLGWSIIENAEIDLKKRRAKICVYQSFECEVGKGSGKPYSQFYRGIIAGWFHRLFGKPVDVKETKCIAKGDPYCEFAIKG